MMYVFVLRSQKDQHFYVGMTSNLQQRIHEHNSSKVKSTKSRIPFELIYFETLPDRITARKREKYLKSSAGKPFLLNSRPLKSGKPSEGFSIRGENLSELNYSKSTTFGRLRAFDL